MNSLTGFPACAATARNPNAPAVRARAAARQSSFALRPNSRTDACRSAMAGPVFLVPLVVFALPHALAVLLDKALLALLLEIAALPELGSGPDQRRRRRRAPGAMALVRRFARRG